VILLLMITKTVQPQVIEQTMFEAESAVAELTEQLFEIRGETTILNRDLDVKREQISAFDEKIAILQGTLARTRSEYDALSTSQNANAIIREDLAIAKQRLSEEQVRLLGLNAEKQNQFIGGIPVDSEYIIFVIDTSQSMFSYAWPRMLRELEATLDIYPEVKGIQVLNDMGDYLFRNFAGEWIPDDPKRRELIISNLTNWSGRSNSSPVEGLTAAISQFYRTDKKISIYIYGDQFMTNTSINEAVRAVDRLNQRGESSIRRVRIHAVGFPVMFDQIYQLEVTGIRFATLMREITQKNGGAFVGLNDFRP